MRLIFMIILALTIIMSGCGPIYRFLPDCGCADTKAMQVWMSQCIKDANNMSDEEMEDVIPACTTAAEKLFCKQRKAELDNSNYAFVRWAEPITCSK